MLGPLEGAILAELAWYGHRRIYSLWSAGILSERRAQIRGFDGRRGYRARSIS